MILQRWQWALIICIFALPASAKLFQNSYVSFELPPNWDCKLDGTEYVCINSYAKQAKEAIIILTAKEVGPTDSYSAYAQHLKTPRTPSDRAGKMVPSKVLNSSERQIDGHKWMDGMHMGREIASYYPRYLATIKERLAILVTFSAHKDHYTKYSNDFLKAVSSLRVIATRTLLEPRPALAQGPSVGEQVGSGIPTLIDTPATLPPEPKDNDFTMKLIALAVLVGAVGIFLWRKSQKR